MRPFVSFIIPAYNSEKTIERCLKAILEQSYGQENFEVIVVDNNSKDGTERIIGRFSQVKMLKEKRQGRSFARNLGAENALGTFLAFIDSDVFLDKDWLSSLMNGFSKPTLGGGQGRVIPSNLDGQERLNKFRIRSQDEATNGSNIILDLMFIESPMINSAACLYRKDAFNFVEGFDPFLERHEDIDLSKRVSLAGYDLFSNTHAIANVEYHAEGWISYFLRSFEEGKTKEAYVQKWKIINKSLSFEMTQSTEDATRLPLKFKKWQIIYYQVRNEIIFNILKGIFKLDIYFFLKAMNAIFKASGRFFGKFFNKYKSIPIILINKEMTSRFLIVNGKKIYIERELRFIYKNCEILYLMNIVTGKFIDMSYANSIKEVFKNNAYE